MPHRHKHVAKNHEIAKKLEIGAEIATPQKGGHWGEMVTNGPHQCVRQARNRGGGGLYRKLQKKFENFLSDRFFPAP